MPTDPQQFADLPNEILEKIKTFSYGGYILFWIDSTGLPQVESEFEEPVDAIALKKFAQEVMNAIDERDKNRLRRELEELQAEIQPPEEEV